MRLTPLTASTLLLLWFCVTASAQQNAPVQKDDSDDPCGRFKLRVLLLPPADGGHESRVRAPAADIDPWIVWNPCPRTAPQVARQNVRPAPRLRGRFVAPPPFGAGTLPPNRDEQRGRPGTEWPRSPSAFEMMRRRTQ